LENLYLYNKPSDYNEDINYAPAVVLVAFQYLTELARYDSVVITP